MLRYQSMIVFFSLLLLSPWIQNAEGAVCTAGRIHGAEDSLTDYNTALEASTDTVTLMSGGSMAIPCCGIITGLKFFSRVDTALTAQTYRPTGGTAYEVLGSAAIASTGANADHSEPGLQMAVDIGDFVGWHSGPSVVPFLPMVGAGARTTLTSASAPSDGDTKTFTVTLGDERFYAFQVTLSPGNAPSITAPLNGATSASLPGDTAVGTPIVAITSGDSDVGDILTVSLVDPPAEFAVTNVSPGNDNLIVNGALTPGTYPVVIRVEDRCKNSQEIVYNIVVSDDERAEITNLPGAANLAETEPGDKLLETLTVVDANTPPEDVTCRMVTDPASAPLVLKHVGGPPPPVWGIHFVKTDSNPLGCGVYKLIKCNVTCNDGVGDGETKQYQVDVLGNVAPTAAAVTVGPISTMTEESVSVHTMVATDTDGGQLKYYMDTTCPFKMMQDGSVLTTQDLNEYREDTCTGGTVTVTDGCNNVTVPITFTFTDVNHAPNFTKPTNSLPDKDAGSIDENNGIGDVVYKLEAVDEEGDAITFKYPRWENDRGKNLFDLQPDGTIVAKTEMDYEALFKKYGETSFTLFATACDARECSDERAVVVTVKDVNEEPFFNKRYHSLTVTEGQTGLELDCGYFTLNDPDFGDTHTFALHCTGAYDVFDIVRKSGDPCTIIIHMSGEYDLDTLNREFDIVPCTLDAFDSENLAVIDMAQLDIKVLPVNEHPPVLPATYEYTISNDTVAMSKFGQVTSTDLDVTDLHSDHLYETNSPIFGVDDAGRFYPKESLVNYTAPQTFTFMLTATDRGGLSDTSVVTVHLTDVPPPPTTTTQPTTVLPAIFQKIDGFLSDKANWGWFIPAVILSLVALGLAGYMLYRCLTTPGACNSCFRCCGRKGHGKIGHGGKRVGAENTGAKNAKNARRGKNTSKSNPCDCFRRKPKRGPALETPPHGRWEPWNTHHFQDMKQWVG